MSLWSMIAWSSEASRSSRHIFLLSEGRRAPTFAQRWAIYGWNYSTGLALQEREIATGIFKKNQPVICGVSGLYCSYSALAAQLCTGCSVCWYDFLILPTLLKSVIYYLAKIERRLSLTRKSLQQPEIWSFGCWSQDLGSELTASTPVRKALEPVSTHHWLFRLSISKLYRPQSTRVASDMCSEVFSEQLKLSKLVAYLLQLSVMELKRNKTEVHASS